MEKFSIPIISKNEEKTLPLLLDSILGYDPNIDIVVVDTGSTDDTIKIAKNRGCIVEDKKECFIEKTTKEDINAFIRRFGWDPEDMHEGFSILNFSKARNYASSLCSNDWVFCPDCDEIPSMNYDKVIEYVNNTDKNKFDFDYCYSHDDLGACTCKYKRDKFFRKSKVKWINMIHETTSRESKEYLPYLTLDHYQNKETKRRVYLPALELAVARDENLDRNLFYLGREYFIHRIFDKAFTTLSMCLLDMQGSQWVQERGEARLLIGDCLWFMGAIHKAKRAYLESIGECPMRRKPLLRLAELEIKHGRKDRAICFLDMAEVLNKEDEGYLVNEIEYGKGIDNLRALIE